MRGRDSLLNCLGPELFSYIDSLRKIISVKLSKLSPEKRTPAHFCAGAEPVLPGLRGNKLARQYNRATNAVLRLKYVDEDLIRREYIGIRVVMSSCVH